MKLVCIAVLAVALASPAVMAQPHESTHAVAIRPTIKLPQGGVLIAGSLKYTEVSGAAQYRLEGGAQASFGDYKIETRDPAVY